MEVVSLTYYAINFMGNICEILINVFFLSQMAKRKYSKKIFIPACLLLLLWQFANTNLFLSKSTLIFFGTTVFCFLSTCLYDLKFVNRVIYTFFLVIDNALSEIIISLATTLILDVTVTEMQGNILLFSVGTLISKFLAYFIAMIASKKVFKHRINIAKQNIVLIFSMPVASIMVMLLFLRCCYQIDDYSFYIITFITTVVLLFANITVFYTIDKLSELIETKEKLAFAEKHISNQVIHYQELYNYQNELRIFRHDIKNRFVSLIGLIKESDTETALQTLEKNLSWLDEMNSNIVNSGNPVIDAILQSKLHSAKEKGIEIDYFIRFTAPVGIDEIELGIVLGNALDNAIEAVDKLTDNDKRRIQFKLITTVGRISVVIENPVSETVDTHNLTTTKEDKERHGHGISSIRIIAQKHDGLVSFSCENNIFTAEISLANRPVTV